MAKTQDDVATLGRLLAQLDESVIADAVASTGRKDLKEALEKIPIRVKLSPIEKPFWKSKKFWGGMVALVIMVLDATPPFEGVQLWTVATPFLVYIFGQGLADLGKNKPV